MRRNSGREIDRCCRFPDATLLIGDAEDARHLSERPASAPDAAQHSDAAPAVEPCARTHVGHRTLQLVEFVARQRTLHREPPAAAGQANAGVKPTNSVSDAKARDTMSSKGDSICSVSTLECTQSMLFSAKLDLRLRQKRNLLLHLIDERHLQIRRRDRKRNAGQPAACAHVEYPDRAFAGDTLHLGHDRQRIEQMMATARPQASRSRSGYAPHSSASAVRHSEPAHPLANCSSCSPSSAAPLMMASAVTGAAEIVLRKVRLQSVGCNYAARRPSPLPLPRRFRCTNSSEIAAGVTPEMREAWPIVSGRCSRSF